MSKRGPIIGIAAIAAVLLCAPYGIGVVAENSLREQIALAEGRPPFTRTITGYERGWFGSVAEIEIGIDPATLATLVGGDASVDDVMFSGFRLPVIVEIGHGPVLLRDGFGLGTASVRAYADPEAELAIVAEQWLGMPYLFDFHGRAGFGTGFKYEGEIPAGEIQMPEFGIATTGFQFTGLIRGTRRVLDGELGNLSLTSPFATASVDGFTLYSDTDRKQTALLPLGEVTLGIDTLQVTEPLQGPQPSLLIEDASLVSSVDVDAAGSALVLGVTYEAGRLAFVGYEGTELALGMRIENIDAEASYELLALVDALGNNPDAATTELLLAPLDRIVAGNPRLVIDPVGFTMAEGRLMGRASASIDATALPSGSFNDLQDPDVMRTAIDASIELVADKTLAARLAGLGIRFFGPDTGLNSQTMTPAQLDAMAALQGQLVLATLSAQGFLVDEGDAWSIEITLADGVPLANGNPLSLGL